MEPVVHHMGLARLELATGDITKQKTEAIVNAANTRLSPGGGVSGAIHQAAGPELWKEAKTLGGCPTGEARITKGYLLPARFVIHTVGPVYSNSSQDPKKLSSCYKSSLDLALGYNLNSISFPSISTGIFGYPVEPASIIALNTVIDYLEKNHKPALVRFVLYSDTDFNTYHNSLDKILNPH